MVSKMDNRFKLRWSTSILPLVVNLGAWTYLVLSTPKEDRSLHEVNSIAQSILLLLIAVVGFVLSNTWLIYLINERLMRWWLSMDSWAETITQVSVLRSDSYIETDAWSGNIITKYQVQVVYSITTETGATQNIKKGWEGIEDAALFEAARNGRLSLRVLKPFPTVAMPHLLPHDDEEQDPASLPKKCHERCCKDCWKPALNCGACFSLTAFSCWMFHLSLERVHLEVKSQQQNNIVVAATWVICVVLAWMITFRRVFFHGGTPILEDEQADEAEGGLPKTRRMTEPLPDEDHV